VTEQEIKCFIEKSSPFGG
jgi:hypothetical protein